MSDQQDPFEMVIRQSGEGWLIDWYSPKDEAVPKIRRILQRANDWGKARFGGNAPTLTPENIVATYPKNPHKVRAFLQVLGAVASPQILVMVWRIIQGMGVASIEMEYRSEETFKMLVRLKSPYGEMEEYESSDIDDAVILRHVGIMKMGDKGIFDGFYALRVG